MCRLLNIVLIFFFSLLLILNVCAEKEFDLPRSARSGDGDVQNMFFSPFRVVGKRNQFYGLFKRIRTPEMRNYLDLE